MSLKAVKFFLIQLFVLVFLTACSSGSSEDSTGNTSTGNSARISLAVLDDSNNQATTVTAGDTLTLQVRVTNTNGLAISGQEVAFSTSSGSLSASSRLTDSNGQAEVVFDSTNLASGVITITASTTYNDEELNVTSQFEVQAGTTEPVEPPVLTLSVLDQNDQAVEDVNEGEQLNVTASFATTEGSAIEQQEVTFTVSAGSVSAASRLTDSNGQANVTFDSTGITPSVVTITASTTYEGQDFSVNVQFEVGAGASPTFTMSVEQDGVAVDQITEGEQLSITANFADDAGVAVEQQEIVFTASAGSVSAASRLTNSNGQATVSFDSTDVSPGVVTITASTTFDGQELSQTAQFEVEAGASPSVSISMEQNNSATNRLNEGEQAVIKVLVVDEENTPVSDTLVTFSADIGTVAPATKLTDANGAAEVALITEVGTTGAGQITASVTIDGEAISNTFAYEVQALASGVLTLSVQDQNNNEVTSITEGNSLSLHANLVSSNGVAISQQEINYSATAGTLSATSKLTGSSGLATVSYDSTGLEPGVVTVTATTTYNNRELSVSKQFDVLQVVQQDTTPSLSVTFEKEGVAVNRMQADENAQISVVLTDYQGQPISLARVEFTADLGTLEAPSALTNDSGAATVTISAAEADLGAGLATATVTVDETTIAASVPYEIVASDVVEDLVLKLGFLDDNGDFQTGIKSSLTNSNQASEISAGGTLGLEISIFDQNDTLYTTPATVSFTSTCVTNEAASIDESITTINGTARTTFEDLSCATAFGNDDIVVASITINSETISATHDIKIAAENLGSIEFVSADPTSISLEGSPGQQTATLTFSVKGELGNSLANKLVSFELNTDVGGISLSSDSGTTNSSGLVSVRVISGTVPTTVAVTATSKLDDNDANSATISTQSNLLSVNTGYPDQNSITLALSENNPEAFDIAGASVTVTAFMADSFNNPVPDGTTINFTTEGGRIGSSCNTTSGTCSVTWESTAPFISNHRVTILATADGQESFVDTNGNNVFDNNDGTAVTDDEVSAGFARVNSLSSGFLDLSDAWLDADEDRVWDQGEQIVGRDNDETFTVADGLFNGPCADGTTLCSSENTIKIRKSAILITSSTAANITVSNSGTNVPANSTITVPEGSTVTLVVTAADTANQTLAVGTTISVTAEGAVDTAGFSTQTIGNTIGTSDPDSFGGISFSVALSNINVEDGSTLGSLTIEVTSPSGEVTSFPILLDIPEPTP